MDDPKLVDTAQFGPDENGNYLQVNYYSDGSLGLEQMTGKQDDWPSMLLGGDAACNLYAFLKKQAGQ